MSGRRRCNVMSEYAHIKSISWEISSKKACFSAAESTKMKMKHLNHSVRQDCSSIWPAHFWRNNSSHFRAEMFAQGNPQGLKGHRPVGLYLATLQGDACHLRYGWIFSPKIHGAFWIHCLDGTAALAQVQCFFGPYNRLILSIKNSWNVQQMTGTVM